jgi:hypothetical protein
VPRQAIIQELVGGNLERVDKLAPWQKGIAQQHMHTRAAQGERHR